MLILSRLLIFRFAVPLCGLLALSVFGFIYVNYPHLYLPVMKAMIKIPGPHPFVDWEYVPSAVRCYSEGINVYFDNTCFTGWPDPQPFPYSPLLLRATFLKAGEHWTNVIGLSVCILFFLSLTMLPPPHDRRNLLLTLFATLSCATFLATERANVDLILFVMIVTGIHLRAWPLAFRLGGYGLIILGGLVKFYPFVALVVVLRERLLVIAMVILASMAALAILLLCDHELALMLANLPAPSYFVLQFGAADLPGGIGVSVGKVLENLGYADTSAARAIAPLVAHATLPILVISAFTGALVIGRGCRLRLIEATLPTRQLDFLVTGAALICGCFFAG